MTYTVGESKDQYPQVVTISTELPEFLWSNHRDLLFETHPILSEIHPYFSRTVPTPYDEALGRLASGWGFFAPVPRVALGNSKEHCAPEFDALYVDIDRQEGVDPHGLLVETVARLPSDLKPSVAVYSGGKGIHCYWKLDSLLPIEEIEYWSKALSQAVGGDSCHDRTRILAHPGTRHRRTGKLIEIIEFTAEVHPVERLDQLPEVPWPPVVQKTKAKEAKGNSWDAKASEEWLSAAEALTGWGDPKEINLRRLMGKDWIYMSEYHAKGWKQGEKTRSDIEARIVHRIVGEGASDEQIREISDGYFSKHSEEKQKTGYRYIDHTIRSARGQWFKEGWITHPSGGGRRKRDAKYRWATVDDHEAHLELVQGQPLGEWVRQVQELGRGRASAYRDAKRLEAVGLVRIDSGRIYRD